MTRFKRFATWSREQRAESKAWSKSRLGRAGDGERELLPWTAGPDTHKYFDSDHPLARDSKGRSLVLVFYSIIQFVWHLPSRPRTMYLAPTADPPHSPFLIARVNVSECRGDKRSKVSPRGALNLPVCPVPANKAF